jgi:hypothetical protein
MRSDYGQQHTCRRVGARPPLFPVAQRGWRETEPGSKLGLTQFHSQPNPSHINLRGVYLRHAHLVILSSCPRDGLVQSLDDALANRLRFPCTCCLPHDRPEVFFVAMLELLFPAVPRQYLRDQTLHSTALGLSEVRLPVLRVGREQEHRQALAVVVVNDRPSSPRQPCTSTTSPEVRS